MRPSRLALVALFSILGCSWLIGCAPERAIRVSVLLDAPIDVVCLIARESNASTGPLAFGMPYEARGLPTPASLTFVAAAAHDGEVAITARGVFAGSFVSGGTILTRLDSPGTAEATVRIARCHERPTAGFGTRPSGTFAALRDPAHMLAADYDGDGRDEVLAVAADGSLVVLDLENADDGSHRESELRTTDGDMVAVGDLNGDCMAEVIAASRVGALVVDSASGQSFAPVGEAAHDVALGRAVSDPRGPTLLFVAGDRGLTAVRRDGSARASLSADSFAHVVTWDQDGDGATEVLATGSMGGAGSTGLHSFSPVAGAFVDVTGSLPPAVATLNGPVAVGDLDGDGDFDLVVAEGATVQLIERSGTSWMSPVPFTIPMASVTRLIAQDVTGDCADDVIVLDGPMRRVLVLSMSGRALRAIANQTTTLALDVVVGDFDAEGSRELAILGEGGRVTLWQP